jgi:hypothetical protein
MGLPREIYLAACGQIAEAFVEDGFNYQPRHQRLVRIEGDLTFDIQFQSSRLNALVNKNDEPGIGKRLVSSFLPSGELKAYGNITLIAHAVGYSKTFELWQSKQPHPSGAKGLIAGGQIGNLQEKHKWIAYNLANPHTREHRIKLAIQLIRSVGLPYLYAFRHPAKLIERLIDGHLQGFSESGALEYAMCFGSTDQAKKLLQALLREFPEQREEYQDWLERYRKNGVTNVQESRRAPRIARAAIALGLD